MTTPKTPKVTGWAYTDAREHVDCPKCGEKAGKQCRSPKGKIAVQPHSERITAYRQKIGDDEYHKRHTLKPISSHGTLFLK